MSSRALRRLQKDSRLDELLLNLNSDELADQKEELKEDDVTEDTSDQNTENIHRGNNNKREKKVKENLFELLSGKDEENPDEDKEEDLSNDEQTTQHPIKNQVKSKKKKKKNKVKRKEAENTPVQQETADDVEASLLEVNRILGDPGSASVEPNISFSATVKPLLHIDYRHLNPETELKRIFGSEIFRREQQDRTRRQRNRPVHRGTRLVQFKDTWPNVRGSGLSMRYIEQTQEFVFEHSLSYQKIQNKFADAVDSVYAENIVDILRENPYHVDTLILVADSRRASEDYEQAADCIERALYVLECAFHPLFNLAAGNCYLSYKRLENRGFFICLFRHIWNLGRKRCNRTAFEFCKLLLSLDPVGDPLDCMSMIDYYALRSDQYDHLIQLEQEVMSHDSMRKVPNFAMSIPLAHFKIALRDAGDTATADQKLQDSLLFFPVMLMPLLDECSVHPDRRVSSHAFFNTAELNDSSSELGSLVTMYVKRCMCCWKEAGVISWLERNVMAVLDIVDTGTDPRLKGYPKLRSQCFKQPPLRLLRHYCLSEIPSLMVRQQHLTSRFMGYDPFPPPDTIRSYTRTPRPTVASRDHSGLLRSFLQSLLPSYNPNEPAVEAAGPNDEEGAAAQGIPQQIHQGVNAVMQAMRQLINDSFAARPPQDAANHENGEDNREGPHDEGGE